MLDDTRTASMRLPGILGVQPIKQREENQRKDQGLVSALMTKHGLNAQHSSEKESSNIDWSRATLAWGAKYIILASTRTQGSHVKVLI